MIVGTALKIGVLDHTGKVYKEVSFGEKTVEISVDSPIMDNIIPDMRGVSCEWTAKMSYKKTRSLLIGYKQRLPRKLKKKLKKQLEKQIRQQWPLAFCSE